MTVKDLIEAERHDCLLALRDLVINTDLAILNILTTIAKGNVDSLTGIQMVRHRLEAMEMDLNRLVGESRDKSNRKGSSE